jgi:hypothetical protein
VGTCLRKRYSVTAEYICLLRICCLAADAVSLSLPSNGSILYNVYIYIYIYIYAFPHTPMFNHRLFGEGVSTAEVNDDVR